MLEEVKCQVGRGMGMSLSEAMVAAMSAWAMAMQARVWEREGRRGPGEGRVRMAGGGVSGGGFEGDGG